MNEVLTQLGVGGVLALLIIREVLNFLDKKRNGKKFGNPIDFGTLYRRVEDIHVWNERIVSGMNVQERNSEKILGELREIKESLRK